MPNRASRWWLRGREGVAGWNPLPRAVDVVRDALLEGAVHPDAATTFVFLAGLGAVLFAGAVVSARLEG